MQKKIIAVAVLGAMAAGTALAADVELYGRIDTGFAYSHQSTTGEESTDSFAMKSGTSSGNRWGLKGSEELGNGLTVGFVLENGYSSDTGALKTDGKIFDRESLLYVASDFGTLYAGRMARLGADAGSVGFYGGAVSPFGSGWDLMEGHFAVTANFETRWDNTVAYVSPKFGPVTVYAQYAMGSNDENESTSDRLFSLGAKADLGNLQILGLVEYLNKQSVGVNTDSNVVFDDAEYDDAYTINLGGSYDFGVAQVFLAGQYFKAAPDFAGMIGKTGHDTFKYIEPTTENGAKENGTAYRFSADGYGLNIGANVPVLGGTFSVSTGYGEGDVNYDTEDADAKIKAYIFQVGYVYPFSKRTSLYVGAGYSQAEVEGNANVKDYEKKTTEVMTGLLHKF